MNPSRWRMMVGVILLVSLAVDAAAQVAARSPRIGYVYPAGGRQGETFQVTLGGQFLDGASDAIVSGKGVTAKVIEHVKPITPAQANALRDQLKELIDKRAAARRNDNRNRNRRASQQAKPAQSVKWTAEDEKRLEEIRKKLATFVRRPPNPAIAETVTVEVAIAPAAEPGSRELRLKTALGLTPPLAFHVGQVPEYVEKEPKQEPESRFAKKAQTNEPTTRAARPPIEITVPITVNGQILPGQVDRFRFAARKGQRLVASVCARQLIPYLPDAVPGWFQATLGLYDAQGRELAYADGYQFSPDPVLACEIPADGQYTIEIKDSIYRGREDFVYRITLGELPLVTSIFPLGGRAGEQSAIELTGWNLPVATLTLDRKDNKSGLRWLSVDRDEIVSNLMPFAVDTLPECLEAEPNDDPSAAQQVASPVIVNGRIDRPDDCDVFQFQGRAGSRIVVEVYARRLNSPLDSVIKLTDAAGKQLASNDDHEDKGTGLLTHHADSWLSVTLPADGSYYLRLSDAQHKGGPQYAYRLRISAPRPDFELRVVPSSITARAGMNVPVTVYALRRDDFAGDIKLALKDAPKGFALSGAWVPAGQDQVRLTLTVPPSSEKEVTGLSIEGRAMIGRRDVAHCAVPAEDMEQAFAYHHLVPAQELQVAVSGPPRPRAAIRLLSETPIRLPAGGTARVQITAPANTPSGKIQLELNGPPDGIAIRSVSPSRGGTQIVLASDAAKVKPGQKGNLIITASMKRGGDSAKKLPPNQRAQPLAALPAIPFEITAR